MELRYTASRSDIRALLLHNLRYARRLQIVLLVIAGIPVLVGAIDLAAEGTLSGRALVPYLVMGLLGAAILPILAILRTKKHERSLHIEPTGIRTTIGNMRGEVAWRQIDYVADDGRRVFITGKSTNGFVVPASAFGSTEDREALVSSMQRWVREARFTAPAS